MPEKRKTEAESDVDLISAKRPRQQLSYADLEDSAEAGTAREVSHESEHDENDEHESTGHGDDQTTGQEKVVRKQKGDRRQNNSNNNNNPRPRVDPVYGQRSAFPGLDDLDSDQLFYGPAEDGLEYLRMVRANVWPACGFHRSEANSLPAFVVAAKSTTQIYDKEVIEREENQGEITADEPKPERQHLKNEKAQNGFILVDGVVIGTVAGTSDFSAVENSSNVQSSYYTMLRDRFVYLQHTLRSPPPAAAISNLDESHPITFPYHLKEARLEWRRIIFTSDPQMVQLACMDMETVLNVLRLLGNMIPECINGKDATQIRRVGAWAWGLLGRCRDVGELGSKEVGELRNFGKQAVSVLIKLNKLESKNLGDESMVLELEDRNELGDELGLPEETAETTTPGNPADEIADTSMPIPTTEPLPLGDTEALDELEAAKLRLQARLQESVDYEDEELEADMAVRRRRNTSSPLSDDEVVQTCQSQETAPEVPSQNTIKCIDKQSRALLDMIITVVGDLYGQRDLLLQREVWQ